jgi:7,8-dihydroneopterin aldolase/epimerase/oxygenase
VSDDWIFLRDFALDVTIGVHAWEKGVRQRLYLDIDLAWDTRQAAATDDLQFALDYSALALRLTDLAQSRSFNLIEALAEFLAQSVLQEFAVPQVRLTLYKPGAVVGARTLGVSITRRVVPGG